MAIMEPVAGTETQILNNVMDAIGNTPLIRINKLARGIRANVLAKVEFFNPGGSVKDRIGPAMIEDAERRGLLKPGGTIVEATSGNTGVGLAIAAAIKGYKTVFVMPDKMSEEKIRLLRAFGATCGDYPDGCAAGRPAHPIIRCPSASLTKRRMRSWLANIGIRPTPRRTIAPPALRSGVRPPGMCDVFIAGMGTGGTISGVSRYLKEQNPAI